MWNEPLYKQWVHNSVMRHPFCKFSQVQVRSGFLCARSGLLRVRSGFSDFTYSLPRSFQFLAVFQPKGEFICDIHMKNLFVWSYYSLL